MPRLRTQLRCPAEVKSGRSGDADSTSSRFCYLVEWAGYAPSERSWEPHWQVLQRGDPELEAQAAALRDAVQRGAA